ncbi:MAG TPA: hypothetical protein VGW76_00550 [Pyrinomonadaceae bacterium]|nr:hypothetical protein [Pyrinomonadaceae bacterium]
MKLCPQCDFIYEDNQGFCDMDGQELVHDSAAGVVDQTTPPEMSTSLPARSRGKRLSVLFVGAVVLTTLLSVIYLGQRQSRTTYAAIPIQSLQQPPTSDSNRRPSQVTSTSNTATDASLTVESLDPSSLPAGTAAALTDASKTQAPSTHATEASADAAAEAMAPNQSAPVILRLTNGSLIKADDAGETRNGVWYRQGGMVTVLKRSQVRAIERRRSSSPRSTIPATPAAGDAAARNQLRLRRLEPAIPKRQSRVTSFLKKTGQILSKPFKR